MFASFTRSAFVAILVASAPLLSKLALAQDDAVKAVDGMGPSAPASGRVAPADAVLSIPVGVSSAVSSAGHATSEVPDSFAGVSSESSAVVSSPAFVTNTSESSPAATSTPKPASGNPQDIDSFVEWLASVTERQKNSNADVKHVITGKLASLPIGSPDAIDDYYYLTALDASSADADNTLQSFRELIAAWRGTDGGKFQRNVDSNKDQVTKWKDDIAAQNGTSGQAQAEAAAASSSSAAATASLVSSSTGAAASSSASA